MKKNFVAAAAAFALIGAASAASATTFTGSYSVPTYNSGTDGLQIQIADNTPGSGTSFSFNLNNVGNSATVNLFKISTPETAVNLDDLSGKQISVSFNFTAPQGASGSVNGTTEAVFYGLFSDGEVQWANNGDTTLNFGSYGDLLVHLNDATFGSDWFDGLSGSSANIKADFTLEAPSVSAVPEPMSWALMLTGFMGLGAALRFSRRQGAALTAA